MASNEWKHDTYMYTDRQRGERLESNVIQWSGACVLCHLSSVYTIHYYSVYVNAISNSVVRIAFWIAVMPLFITVTVKIHSHLDDVWQKYYHPCEQKVIQVQNNGNHYFGVVCCNVSPSGIERANSESKFCGSWWIVCVYISRGKELRSI